MPPKAHFMGKISSQFSQVHHILWLWLLKKHNVHGRIVAKTEYWIQGSGMVLKKPALFLTWKGAGFLYKKAPVNVLSHDIFSRIHIDFLQVSRYLLDVLPTDKAGGGTDLMDDAAL